jgi:hypothetical protein
MMDTDQPQMLLNDRGSHGGHSVWVLAPQSALDADKRAAEEAAQEFAHTQQAALREREVHANARSRSPFLGDVAMMKGRDPGLDARGGCRRRKWHGPGCMRPCQE